MSLHWVVAADVDEVHRLLEASDRHAAASTGTEPPSRRRTSTVALVTAECVYVGHARGRPVVTVTVGQISSFDAERAGLPAARNPWYMQRLAMDPATPDKLAGFAAVRHAVSVARAGGADVLRAEANPDLTAVLRMLTAVGFRRYGTDEGGGPPRTYLQLSL